MDNDQERSEWLDVARSAMEIEGEAILSAARRLNEDLCRATELILKQSGKLVITALGKSGLVGRKLVATLCSTGTPAVFVHPVEALHGDLGIFETGDPALMISKSGTTAELLRLVPVLRGLDSPLIGILGAPGSPLALQMDVVLDGSVRREADPQNLVPTASSAVALAIGDALACALMRARNFQGQDFGRYHPAGRLGRSLRMRVAEVMHRGSGVAWASPEDPLRNVVIAMTALPLGAACVVEADGRLAGLITDGDLRRALQKHEDLRGLRASDVMTPGPLAVRADALLAEALTLMEDRPSQLSVLPVISPADGRCLGLIRLHDLYHAGGG
jgi:arabinose-5-phosphate isomerase